MILINLKYILSDLIIILYFIGIYFDYESMLSTVNGEKKFPNSIIYIGKISFIGNYIKLHFNRNLLLKYIYNYFDINYYFQLCLLVVYDIFIALFLNFFLKNIFFSFIIINFVYKCYIYLIEYQTDTDKNNKYIYYINPKNIIYDEGNKFLKFLIYFIISLLCLIYFIILIIELFSKYNNKIKIKIKKNEIEANKEFN